jgi:hypothetical protein
VQDRVQAGRGEWGEKMNGHPVPIDPDMDATKHEPPFAPQEDRMKIVSPKTLAKFRGAGRCELCTAWCANREPHHAMACGHGGGNRLDVSVNLVSVGVAFTCQCHRKTHDGNASRAHVLAVIGKRVNATPEAVWECLCVLSRLPKGACGQVVEEHLAEVSGEVAALVRAALTEGD